MTEGDSTARVRQRFGHYEILGPLGRGGMGVVYRALDMTLDRVVALKVLHDHLRTRPQCVSRLQREARAIAGLNHPNIVQVYSVGEIGKVAYFAMEYIDGRPLSSVLIQEGPLHWERALGIAAQIADALACAHEAQIIHRDVKPPNIILTEDDKVCVTDFGVAKVLTAETQLTVDASRLGTPSYMSPEHCQNVEVTAASDFYSLGVLVFQMISGRLPHEASTRAGLVNKIIGSPPARLHEYVPDVPEGVDRLVAHLLEKRPKDRPANGRILCELIARVRSGATLDEECRDRVAVMATLRKSLTEPTPRTPSSGADEPNGRRSGRPRSSSAGDRSSTQGWRVAPRRWLADGGWRSAGWILAVWAGICSATTGTLLGQWDAPEFFAEAADTGLAGWNTPAEAASFTESGQGVVLAQVNLPGSIIKSAGWLDASNAAGVLGGTSGTVLCSLQPEARRAAAHFLPGRERETVSVIDFCGAVHRDSPMASRLLIAQPADGSLGAWLPPSPQVESWRVGQDKPGLKVSSVAALPSNGRYVATVVSGPEHPGLWTVVQQEMSFGGPGGSPRTLSQPGVPVVALQYSPDGLRLAYLREAALGQRELWVVRTDGSETEGSLLTRGHLALFPGAFSPDGSRMAVINLAGGRGQLQILQTTGGAGQEAAGDAAEAAWHPSGTYLVVTAPDSEGRLQLWTVEAHAPHRRKALARFDTGLTPVCRISPDGSQAMAVLKDPSDTVLAFVRLAPPSF